MVMLENIGWVVVSLMHHDKPKMPFVCIIWFHSYSNALWVLFLFPFCRWGKQTLEVNTSHDWQSFGLVLGYLGTKTCSKPLCWISWPLKWYEFCQKGLFKWINPFFPQHISVSFIPGLFHITSQPTCLNLAGMDAVFLLSPQFVLSFHPKWCYAVTCWGECAE